MIFINQILFKSLFQKFSLARVKFTIVDCFNEGEIENNS